MVEAQTWLENNYKDKKEEKINFTLVNILKKMKGEEKDEKLEGKMSISGYSELKEIDFTDAKGITELTIENCPNIEVIILYGNPITEIPWLNELPNLRRLNCGNTEIKGIDISGNAQLSWLSLNKNNRTIKIDGFKDFVKRMVYWNSIEGMEFPWEQILGEDLIEIAEVVGIEEGEMKDRAPGEIKELIKKKVGELQGIKDKVKEIPGLVDGENKIDDDRLNELKELKPGEIKKLVEDLKKLGIGKVGDIVGVVEGLKGKNELLENCVRSEFGDNALEEIKERVKWLEEQIAQIEVSK